MRGKTGSQNDDRRPKRRSIRLPSYDYSQIGAYFVTLCTKDRKCLFGKIRNQEMGLNDAGRMVEKWGVELENKFPDIKCAIHIIMPNHFHGIIQNVGADPCVCPNDDRVRKTMGKHVTGEHMAGEHIGSPLRQVIQWFKTMTTNEYIRGVKQHGWPTFPGKLWQRNYYEHIIRDHADWDRIHRYIESNPANWAQDEENT